MMSSFKSGNFLLLSSEKFSAKRAACWHSRRRFRRPVCRFFLFLAKEFRKAHIKHRGHNPFWLNLNNARHKHPQIRLSLPLFRAEKREKAAKVLHPGNGAN